MLAAGRLAIDKQLEPILATEFAGIGGSLQLDESIAMAVSPSAQAPTEGRSGWRLVVAGATNILVDRQRRFGERRGRALRRFSGMVATEVREWVPDTSEWAQAASIRSTP